MPIEGAPLHRSGIEIDPSPPSHRGIGWALTLLGVLDGLRLIPEAHYFRSGWSTTYFALCAADGFVAVGMITAGIGLLRQKPWGASAALWAIGSFLANCAATMWLFFGPDLLQSFDLGSWDLPSGYVPRLLFYVVAIGFSPYVLVVFLRESDSRRWIPFVCLAGGLVASAGLIVAIKVLT